MTLAEADVKSAMAAADYTLLHKMEEKLAAARAASKLADANVVKTKAALKARTREETKSTAAAAAPAASAAAAARSADPPSYKLAAATKAAAKKASGGGGGGGGGKPKAPVKKPPVVVDVKKARKAEKKEREREKREKRQAAAAEKRKLASEASDRLRLVIATHISLHYEMMQFEFSRTLLGGALLHHPVQLVSPAQ